MAALLALGLGREAHAATLTVINNNDSGAGSLRQAIADAAPGDTISFNPALSGQTITLTTGELLISKNLTIVGPVGSITINGNNASRVFDITNTAIAKMSNLNVASGNSASLGGGILNDGTLTLTNSTIRQLRQHRGRHLQRRQHADSDQQHGQRQQCQLGWWHRERPRHGAHHHKQQGQR